MPRRAGSRRFLGRRLTGLAACGLLAAVLLSGCAPEDRRDEDPGAGQPPPPLTMPEGYSLSPVDFDGLPGWNEDLVSEALPALRRSCDRLSARAAAAGRDVPLGGDSLGSLGGTLGAWADLCAEMDRALPRAEPLDEITFRAFLIARFQPFAVDFQGKNDGLFTGYYEAELRGSRVRTDRFRVPVRGLPADLITVNVAASNPDLGASAPAVGRREGDRVLPYWTRAELEDGAAKAHETVLFWAEDPVDVHILHIQGSGRIMLPDGTVERVGFAGHNGHGFVGIGRVMRDRGLLEPGKSTMPHIRAWLKANPDQAGAIMRENPRYIFFRALPPGSDGPIGAQGVALTPKRSLAVDTRFVPLGIPLWLDTHDPDNRPLRRLMVAQDVGSAIKGAVRGDFFWGFGEPALADAGRMMSRGTWYLLLPRGSGPEVEPGPETRAVPSLRHGD